LDVLRQVDGSQEEVEQKGRQAQEGPLNDSP